MLRPIQIFALIGAMAVLPALHAQTFTSKGLVGVGRVVDSKKDKFLESFGSLSGLAIDLSTLTRNASGSTYSATLYAQPDRGYVKSGVTNNYRPRINKLSLSFNPANNGSFNQDQVSLSLTDTTLLTESDGKSLTGMDPSATTTGTRAGISPRLPQASNGNLSLDAEGLVRLPDGTFFVCDEYGPYLYRFSAAGVLLGATRPPEALIPKRGNQDSFSSDNPATGQPSVSPSDPAAGRANNKGLEGLSLSADSRTLYALMQSATRQDTSSGQNRFTRLLAYDITNPAAPALASEWVLPLPLFSSSGADVAEAHEILALDSRHFLVLTHDGNGRGSSTTTSAYRRVLVYDTSTATNIAGTTYDNPSSPLAANGVLANNITPATSTVLVDLNDATQLVKFGLNNTASDNANTLSNAWESLALLPALDAANPDDFYLLVGNDNNFSTSSGVQDGNSYNASPNIDTMILAYRVTLPGTVYAPIITTQPASRAGTTGQAVTLTATASGNPAPGFQWSKDGVAIAGATSASLALPSAQPADSGAYTVVATNSAGSTTSAVATLTITTSSAAAIATQPISQTVTAGSTVVFSVTASGSPTPTYQWRKDGLAISGATASTLVLSGTTGATATAAGSYSVVVSNSGATVTSSAATLTVSSNGDPSRLTNLSVLTDITAGSNFTVATVVGPVGSSGTKPLVVRVVGPSLAAITGSSAGLLPSPKLDLFLGSGTIASNAGWGGGATLANAMAGVGAFAFIGPNSADAAAFLPSLSAGGYSVIASGVNNATGLAIAEIYDAASTGAANAASPRLINVSVLKQIASGGALTLGFTIGPQGGTNAKTVLIRVVGPGLAAVLGSTAGTLTDPQLTLFNGSNQVVATNDDWGADPQLIAAESRVGAFLIGTTASKDSMLIITLPAGAYTARATGGASSSGLAIVEVYEVP